MYRRTGRYRRSKHMKSDDTSYVVCLFPVANGASFVPNIGSFGVRVSRAGWVVLGFGIGLGSGFVLELGLEFGS